MRWLPVLIALAACNDFATPPELAAPQILGVRAEPPAIPAGERAALTALVAGPDGTIEPQRTEWAVVEAVEGAPVIGAIEVDGDGVYYRAPDALDDPALATVQVTVEVAGDDALVALKAVGVGLPMATDNPVIARVLVNGEEVPDGGEVVLAVGEPATLDAEVAPFGGNDVIYSWYSTQGEIELYRRSPTEIVGPDEPGDGHMYFVYRDGRGGIAWWWATVRVE